MARDPQSLKIARWASQTPANRGAIPDALRTDGWDILRSLPVAAGGEDLRRLYFNQLFLELTSAWAEINQRGIPEWYNTGNFRRFAPCQHANTLWIAEVATGPDTGNATEPGTDAAIWRQLGDDPASDVELDYAPHASIFKNVKWAGLTADHRTDPADSFRLTGWPAGYSAVDGDLPSRTILNQILCELTAMAVEILETGILLWSADGNYLAQAFTQRNRILWRATEATGPDTSNATDPTAGGQTIWIRISGEQNAPERVVPTGDEGINRVDLMWPAPNDGGSPITRYEVQWRSGNQNFSSSRQTDVTVLAYARTGLMNGTTYTFRVRAVNAIGNGPWSANVVLTPQATAPGIPGNLMAAALASAVRLTYEAAEPNGEAVNSYVIEWKGPGQNYNQTRRAATPNLQFDVTGLTNGLLYTFRVRAVNAIGSGAWTDEVTETPFAGIPGKPISPSASQRDGALRYRFTAPNDGGSPITRYEVQWRLDTGVYSSALQNDITDTTTLLTSLQNGDLHFIQSRAVNDVGNGPWSDEVSKTPQPSSITLTASQTWSWIWDDITEGVLSLQGGGGGGGGGRGAGGSERAFKTSLVIHNTFGADTESPIGSIGFNGSQTRVTVNGDTSEAPGGNRGFGGQLNDPPTRFGSGNAGNGGVKGNRGSGGISSASATVGEFFIWFGSDGRHGKPGSPGGVVTVPINSINQGTVFAIVIGNGGNYGDGSRGGYVDPEAIDPSNSGLDGYPGTAGGPGGPASAGGAGSVTISIVYPD